MRTANATSTRHIWSERSRSHVTLNRCASHALRHLLGFINQVPPVVSIPAIDPPRPAARYADRENRTRAARRATITYVAQEFSTPLNSSTPLNRCCLHAQRSVDAAFAGRTRMTCFATASATPTQAMRSEAASTRQTVGELRAPMHARTERTCSAASQARLRVACCGDARAREVRILCGVLPRAQQFGRIWSEADINHRAGFMHYRGVTRSFGSRRGRAHGVVYYPTDGSRERQWRQVAALTRSFISGDLPDDSSSADSNPTPVLVNRRYVDARRNGKLLGRLSACARCSD